MTHDRHGTQAPPNFFAGPYLDRRSEAREDPHWVAAARADPDTLYLIARETTQLVVHGNAPVIAFLPNTAPAVQSAADEALTLLGWFRERRCVLLNLHPEVDPALPADTRFEELRPLSGLLDAEEAGLLATARALTVWRARHCYCGTCGAPTRPTRAGHCVVCTKAECGSEFFPRLDPAIIVLVSDGERALLGRQSAWPTGRYSTIAGFVEPGESLEDAVVREVLEETGVAIHDVCYDSSQPWPFPASIMLGFRARALAGSRVCIGGELEDARWVSREQVRSGRVLAPPSQSISWRLISTWMEEAP